MRYRPSTNSLSEGQVLSEPYPFEKARIIVREMVEALAFQMMSRKVVTDSITLIINYDRESVDKGIYHGEVQIDHYGRSVPKAVSGTVKLDAPSNLCRQLTDPVLKFYDSHVDRNLTVRRVTLNANRLMPGAGISQMDLFTDTAKIEKQKRLQETLLALMQKYNKNAILRSTNYEDGATMRERNNQVGGHKA